MTTGDPKMKILVVDDFPTMRRIVKTLLRQSGYGNFVEAEGGDKAKEVLAKHPDVAFVVTNWTLPEGSGTDFLKTVRGDPKFGDLPFLVVTGEADRESTMEAIREIKRTAFIVKPFTGQALDERLRKALGKKAVSGKTPKAG